MGPRLLLLYMAAAMTVAGCTRIQPVSVFETAHRYFLEIDRPGTVYSLLENPKYNGAIVRLLEINEEGRAISDTLRAWVQHYNGIKKFPEEAAKADLIIACHREKQPEFAQALHVLPESRGEIYIYMMRNALLVVSDKKIAYYDVLIAARNAR